MMIRIDVDRVPAGGALTGDAAGQGQEIRQGERCRDG